MPIDGPRALRPGEMPALRALEEAVFRPGMPDEYPQVFHEGNLDGLTVCFDGERCVSHAGMVTRGASILGCRVDLGMIGGVATDPDYRGQGLAGACVDHALAKARRDGLDFVLVSGDRSLYLRRGCATVGRDALFTLDPAAAARLADAAPALGLPRVRIEALAEGDDAVALLSDIYRREPVRFLRHREDYADLMRCGVVLDRPSDFVAVRDAGAGTSLAYAIAPRERTDAPADKPAPTPLLAEVSGDRRAIVAALPLLLRRYERASGLRLHVSRHDAPLRDLLTRAGVPSEPAAAEGTVRLVNFPQMMERLRPLWTEALGRTQAARLSFAEEGDDCVFLYERDDARGAGALRLGVGDAARLVFGTADRKDESLLEGADPELAEALRAVLPVPALWYGLSFV